MENSNSKRKDKLPLVTQIMKFRKLRKWLGLPLILFGLVGLLVPVIPGIIFLVLGIIFINPSLGDKISEKFL